MDAPQIISHIEKSVNYSLYDVKWMPCSAKYVTVGCHPNNTGIIQLYEVAEGCVKLLFERKSSNPIKCGTFGASRLQDRFLATGDFAGHLHVWDLENSSSKYVYSAKAHDGIINCIDGVGGPSIGQGAAEIVTGGRDGVVRIWDTRQKDKPVVNIQPEDCVTARDCWAVAFGNSYSVNERCVCSGYDNGDIKMFDLRTMNVKWETNVSNGVCSIEFDRKDIEMNKLVVTTLESKIHLFDLRTQHSTKGFASITEKAHDSTVWVVSHLPQNRDIFMTAGGQGTVLLWKYLYPTKRFKEYNDGAREGITGSLTQLQQLKLSSQPISSFDWNRDKTGLGVCTSFDQVIRILIVTKLNSI